MTATAPSPQNVIFQAYAGLGNTPGLEELAFNISDTGAKQANEVFKAIVKLAANTTDQALNLATFLDSVDVIEIQDVTSGNTDMVSIALASGLAAGAKIQLGVGQLLVYRNGNATPPTLYFTSMTTDALRIQVTAIGTKN